MLQCFTKSLFPVTRKTYLCAAIGFLEQIYLVNTKSSSNNQIFTDFTALLSKIITALKWIGVLALIIYITSPAILYLIDDSHLESIFPWVLPGTMPGSTNMQHYIINQTFNVFITFWAIDYYILFAMLFTFLLMHVTLLSNIMSNNVLGIDRMLLGKCPSNYEIKMKLKNVILMHIDLSAWVLIVFNSPN